MQDMVPRGDRSIRNIPVSKKHQRAAKAPARAAVPQEHEHEPDEEEEQMTPAPRLKKRRGGRVFVFSALGIVVVCGIGGLLLSTLFAGATVTVYSRTAEVTPPSELTAQPNAPTGSLAYEVMTVSRSASTSVSATGTTEVSRAASGVITIYNSFNTDSQRLIANTRFEAPDGKIYRVRESVVVPGKNSSGAPGSISATVYADSPGAEYNRGAARYTIPGFKGDPRYDDFYAEGTAMSGGYVGPEPSVAPADLTRARASLEQGLAQAAQATLTSQMPTGYLAVPGTLNVTYSDLAQTSGSGNTAILAQSATMSAAIVSQAALASAVAKAEVEGYAGEPVLFADPSALTLTAANSEGGGPITIRLSGSPTLVWQYDETALKEALLGAPKDDFLDIISLFAPAIVRAEAKLRPFWEGTFPADPEDITLVAGVQE